jgi:hypothetical protein
MGDQPRASLRGPKLKLERAKSHIGDLEEAVKRFFDTDPYKIIVEDNPQAGRREHRVVKAQDPPACLSAISGDVIHNLRTSLDHLIWQLILANSRKPNENAAFPIWRSESKFKSGRPGYAKGISKQALDVLYALKPYKGGNDALWRLHHLDIVDKHRLLLTVASGYQNPILDMGVLANRLFDKPAEEAWGPMPLAINPAERIVVREGATLFGAPLGDKNYDDVKFSIAVALYESEVPEGEPLIKALHELASFVDETIDLFAPLIGE